MKKSRSCVLILLFSATLSLCHAHSMQSTAHAASSKASFNQRALANAPPFPRTWVPLGSTYEMDGSRPNKVQFLGQSFVCYQNDLNDPNSWTVVDDACPHRLAPLSEGRVINTDAATGNEIKLKDLPKHSATGKTKRLLECAYHGWAFDKDGRCNRIPQATLELQQRTINNNPNCHVQGYSTRVSKNILFAWLWPEDCLQFTQDEWRQPEYLTENMLEDGYTYTRDAQYGWDTLLENIIDLSHLPWAHHGQQGTRDDTVIMNITAIGKPLEQGMKFSFDDKTMALDRTGLLDFRAPFFMLLYSQLQPKSKDDMPKYFDMNLVMIPTKPGWNRLIVCTGSGKRSGEEMAAGSANDSTQAATKKLPKASVFGRVYRRLPVWIKHQFTHRIIDADIILLHKQEEERTTNRGVDYDGYCMPATSDRVITPIRRWVSKYAHIPSLSINGDGSGGRVVLPEPPVQRSVLFDRWSQHSDQCKHCHKALDGVKTWRRNNFMIMAVSIIAAKYLAARVALVGCLAMWRLLHVAEESLTKGQCDHYKNH